MSRKLNPDKKFILKWTRPGTCHHYTNRFLTQERADKRFKWLSDRGCNPVWVSKEGDKLCELC